MSDEFEVLAALRDDRCVFMLDHDPEQAARWHGDRHLAKAILEAAQLLSTAWHALDNAAFVPLADDPADDPVTPWLVHRVALALTGKESLVERSAHLRTLPGEMTGAGWQLHGQRIYRGDPHAGHPSAAWVRALGGNYLWLWQLGMSLCREYTRRYGKHHVSEPVLWTLEAAPPSILDTCDTWAECPLVMPEACKVVVGGHYDAVASCRRYYTERKQALWSWTSRKPPPWIPEGGAST